MLQELIFRVDEHRGAPNEILIAHEFGPNVFYLGDNHDLAECRPDNVVNLTAARQTLEDRAGDNYIDGNHERNSKVNKTIIRTIGKTRIVMAHGDFESWGDERAISYRSDTKGSGMLKRGVWVPGLSLYETFVGRSPSKSFIKTASLFAKDHGCNVYICGHLHPKKQFDAIVDGVRVIILKRGRTVIPFES